MRAFRQSSGARALGGGLALLGLGALGCRGGATPSERTAKAREPGAASTGAPATPTAPPDPAPQPPSGPRIGALSSRVYVRERPRPTSAEIGILHLGAAVALREAEPVSRDGCSRGWYAVEPEGFVCLDASTTLDVEEHPLMRAKRTHHGQFASATPFRWAESREALLYKKIPTREEQRRTEFELDRHLARSKSTAVDGAAPELFANGALSPWAAVNTPRDARPRAKWVPTRSALAVTDEFFAEGRSWVLTEDLLVAPRDKLVILEPSRFAGVHLDGVRARLPLAFVKGEPKPKYRVEASATEPAGLSHDPESSSELGLADAEDPLRGFRVDRAPGRLVAADGSWERLAFTGLTGRVRRQKGARYLETTEPNSWIRERDATLVQSEPPYGIELIGSEKWIDVNIFRGTLVAYEGTRAVFATLISPGANGYKRVDGKPAKHTTPTGTFRLEWKHRSTTMSPDPERMSYFLAEVPFTQFFHLPFALHAAYWHDRFGEPKSGGCVNLSPADAQWLFGWTEPRVPEGWHGVRSGEGRGAGTWVRVR